MPTPLLIFQLALIPGSLLTGFLLSPVLILSRRIARRPAHRLRHPSEKQTYRKALAAAFYVGAALICGGIIGSWTQWCLSGRNPWLWVIMWMMDGRRWWSRPALISYWGLLAAISVAGWSRQLIRARRKKAWTATTRTADGRRHITVRSSAGNSSGIMSDSASQSHPRSISPVEGHPARPGVATQVMDGVDHRMPTLSVNARRKFFHALAVVLFVPGMIIDVSERRSSWFSLQSADHIDSISRPSLISHARSHSPPSPLPNTFDTLLCTPSERLYISFSMSFWIAKILGPRF